MHDKRNSSNTERGPEHTLPETGSIGACRDRIVEGQKRHEYRRRGHEKSQDDLELESKTGRDKHRRPTLSRTAAKGLMQKTEMVKEGGRSASDRRKIEERRSISWGGNSPKKPDTSGYGGSS